MALDLGPSVSSAPGITLSGSTPATHANATPILGLPSPCTMLPINAVLTHMAAYNVNGFAIAGGLDVGTTIGAADVMSGIALGARAPVAKNGADFVTQYFNTTAPTPLCVTPHTNWSGQVYTVRFSYLQGFQ